MSSLYSVICLDFINSFQLQYFDVKFCYFQFVDRLNSDGMAFPYKILVCPTCVQHCAASDSPWMTGNARLMCMRLCSQGLPVIGCCTNAAAFWKFSLGMLGWWRSKESNSIVWLMSKLVIFFSLLCSLISLLVRIMIRILLLSSLARLFILFLKLGACC